jgi:hypothetical protein
LLAGPKGLLDMVALGVAHVVVVVCDLLVPTPCLGNLRDGGSTHAMCGDTAAYQKAMRSSRAAWEAGVQTQRKLTPCGRGTCHRGWCR